MDVPIVTIPVKVAVIVHVRQHVKVRHLEVPLDVVLVAIRVRVVVVLHVQLLVGMIVIMDAGRPVQTIAPIIVLVDAIGLVLVPAIQHVLEHVTIHVETLVGDHVI